MKKHIIKIMAIICIAFIVVAIGGYVAWKNYIPTEIQYIMPADTTVDLGEPREVVGVSKYVFVGYVQETYDYYTEKSSRDFPEMIDYYDVPFTECHVKIVASIKGNLEDGSSFSFYKVGGITQSRNCILLHEDDVMPEKGKYYIFTGIAHADGTMTGGGSNGTIELEADINENNLDQSKTYQIYLDAYKNQILPDSKSEYPEFICVADENYGDGTYNAKLYEDYAKSKKEKGSFNEQLDKAVKNGNNKIK
ncbi:MAG: hypothetical protein IKU66_07160 [Clostridia bacterium]|nr:hypothetical protein [Clostridia bacterium]